MNEDTVSRVGQLQPVNVCTAGELRAQCSLVSRLHLILQYWTKVLCDCGNQIFANLFTHARTSLRNNRRNTISGLFKKSCVVHFCVVRICISKADNIRHLCDTDDNIRHLCDTDELIPNVFDVWHAFRFCRPLLIQSLQSCEQ